MPPEVISAENLQSLAGIRHGFFTREWGSGGQASTYAQSDVVESRRLIAEKLSVTPSNLISCHQIHSPDVVTVETAWMSSERPQADAMVTNRPGIGLGILTADCVPLLLADPKAGVIGAAHAGWRGAVGGVIENTLAAMEKLGARRSSTHVAIGPCIGPNSYEVGPEFPAPFVAENPDNQRFFRLAVRDGHYMFDLPGYVAAKLVGLKVASVEPSPADTCADETRFFSYRRSFLQGKQRSGNLISVIVLGE